jgi:magnesium transporter
MIGRMLRPEIASLVGARDFATLRDVLQDWEAADIADLVGDLDDQDRAVVFRLLPHRLALAVFECLGADLQQDLLKAMGREEVAAILNEMAPDDRTALLEELPGPVVKELLMRLTPEERNVAQKLLGYPEESIGRKMTPDYIAVRASWTVQQVLDHIRSRAETAETLTYVYVVDDRGVLVDDIRINQVLVAPLDARMSALMNETFVSLSVSTDQETAAAEFKKYNREALPVVDSAGHLVGIVTADDMLDIAEEEATEDIQKFGGMEALEDPYLNVPLVGMIRKRAGWLVILMVGEMLTASAMAAFEHEIASAVVLALFVPLIISSGGNSGSQAATLVIRGLAVGEFSLREWWKVMRRELLTGAALGVILGSIGFARIWIWSAVTGDYGAHWVPLGATVGLSLMGVVLLGTIAGSMLPFVLKRLGADPAASSAPFVATIVDVAGLLLYFSVAAAVLRGTLL